MNVFAFTRYGDSAKVIKILRSLEACEFEALNRFPTQRQDSAKIAADLGMEISHFRELRSRVKRAYLGYGEAKLNGSSADETATNR
jgi:hypothetical protein